MQHLVLLGGGHTHALVLRALARKPLAGAYVTLVSPGRYSPYSGMLPGSVAGHYSFAESHIDLDALCQRAGARFLECAATALAPQARQVSVSDGSILAADVLSIDIGAGPGTADLPGASLYATPVKPVAELWRRWQEHGLSTAGGRRIAVVGGGPGGVELVLAMAHRRRASNDRFCLFSASPALLPGYSDGTRRSVFRALRGYGIAVFTATEVVAVEPGRIHLANGRQAGFDELFWSTEAAAPGWVAESGLPVDADGFIAVNDTLQSPADERIFAVGDIASLLPRPCPKAGVYAVRQAPVLAHNLRAMVNGGMLRRYRPQHRFLSILSLGGQRAVVQRGVFHVSGGWVWRWKDCIDRRFMAQFPRG